MVFSICFGRVYGNTLDVHFWVLPIFFFILCFLTLFIHIIKYDFQKGREWKNLRLSVRRRGIGQILFLILYFFVLFFISLFAYSLRNLLCLVFFVTPSLWILLSRSKSRGWRTSSLRSYFIWSSFYGSASFYSLFFFASSSFYIFPTLKEDTFDSSREAFAQEVMLDLDPCLSPLNISLETSIRNRLRILEEKESRYLLGLFVEVFFFFFAEIKAALEKSTTLQSYSVELDWQSRYLQIMETRQDLSEKCLHILSRDQNIWGTASSDRVEEIECIFDFLTHIRD